MGSGGYNEMGSYGNQGGEYQGGPQRTSYNQGNRYSGPYGGNYFLLLSTLLYLFIYIYIYLIIKIIIYFFNTYFNKYYYYLNIYI